MLVVEDVFLWKQMFIAKPVLNNEAFYSIIRFVLRSHSIQGQIVLGLRKISLLLLLHYIYREIRVRKTKGEMFVVKETLRYRVLFIFKGEKSKKMAIPIWEGAPQQLRYQETILHFVFVFLILRLFARTMLFLMQSVKKTI